MSFYLFPKPLGAQKYNVRFLCSKTIGRALGSVLFNAYERATTEMPNTLQPDQSFRRTYELYLLALNVPCLRSPTATFYTALILDVLLLIFGLEVAQNVA